MALVKCRECGKEVSTKAQACPHCGFKRRGHPFITSLKALVGLYFLLVAIALIAVVVALITR